MNILRLLAITCLVVCACGSDSTVQPPATWADAATQIRVLRDSAVTDGMDAAAEAALTKRIEDDVLAIVNHLPLLKVTSESPDLIEVVKVKKPTKVVSYGIIELPVALRLKKSASSGVRFSIFSRDADGSTIGDSTLTVRGEENDQVLEVLRVEWEFGDPARSALASVAIRLRKD